VGPWLGALGLWRLSWAGLFRVLHDYGIEQRGTGFGELLSTTADGAHRVTWCCMRKLCGERQYRSSARAPPLILFCSELPGVAFTRLG
jgi:hypothetical protein